MTSQVSGNRLLSRLGGRIPGGGRTVVICGLVLLVLGGVWVGWKKWGQGIASGESYLLTQQAIQISPPPPWIKADLKAEVFRDGSLNQLNLLDPQATLKIAGAFGVHSWVAKVRRVSKRFGPQVMVELDYRKPIAMVEVNDQGSRGLLPVDQTAVLLPPEDFTADDTRNYLRIAAGDSMPAGMVGTAWGDPTVAGATHIAAQLADWQAWGLYRLSSTKGELHSRPQYEIQTRHGTRILWGHAPEAEPVDEAKSHQKLARLARYVQEHGPLDTQPPQVIDLRNPRELSVIPQTARQ